MFWEKFSSLCADRGISPNAAAKSLSIASGTVTKWKNGATPQNATAKKIAEFFGVSVDYLLGVEDEKKPPEKDDLPEGLEDLAELYAKLTPEMRETMAALLSSLGELPEDRQQFVVQAVRLALGRQ